MDGIIQLKQLCQNSFHMKDLGALTYFLGLEVFSSPHGIILCQKKYTKDLIALARLTDDKVADTPMEINVKYKHDDSDPIPDPTMYLHLVGILIYLTMTCPDVLYAVKFGNQFVANPRCLHLSALHCIIYYLCGTVDHALFFSSRSSFHHDGFADANWVGCPDRENF